VSALLDLVVLVLRRGALPALGAAAVIFAPVAALAALAFFDRGAPQLGTLVMLVALIAVPFAGAAAFTAFTIALERAPTFKEGLAGSKRAGDVAPPMFLALLPVALFGGAAGLAAGLAEDLILRRKEMNYTVIPALFGVAFLAAFGAFVWTDYVVLTIAAAFVDRVDAAEAARRARERLRPRLGSYLATNAPTLLLLAAIPVGPAQAKLEAVLAPQQLVAIRLGVGFVALVAALVLHAAAAVAVYRAATSPSPP